MFTPYFPKLLTITIYEFTFSFRRSSDCLLAGFSMATRQSTCNRWFCITSLKQRYNAQQVTYSCLFFIIVRRRQNMSDVRLKTCTVDCVFYIRALRGACECPWKYRMISSNSPAQLEIKDTIPVNEVKYGCL